MTSGWSAQPSSHSPWNAGILLDVPAILNAYPPGLGYGAWRTSSASTPSYSKSASSYSDNSASASIGSKRSRPPLRSTRRAPPPPAARSRLLVSQPEDPFADSHSSVLAQDENNIILYKSAEHAPSPPPIRITVPSQNRPSPSSSSSSSSRFSAKQATYPLQYQEWEIQLAKQRAAADKEARLKVIASILLNRVNVVGKPMRRRPGQGAGRAYVRSGLGRCVAVAE